MYASVDDDALNRALFAAWGTGLLEGQVTEATLGQLGLALTPGTLRAEYVLRVIPELGAYAVLSAWGNTGGPEDINGDGIVSVLDLLELLSAWGPC